MMPKTADIILQNKRSKLYEDLNGEHIRGDLLPSTHEPGFKRKASSVTTATTRLCGSPPKRIKSTTIPASTLETVPIHAMRETVNEENEDTGPFCLVTLKRGLSACLSQCHVVSPVLGIKKSIKLTYAWGYRYGTLDMDTEFNLLCLTQILHHSFVANQWGLLPLDEDVIKQLVRKPVQVLNQPIQQLYENQTTFRYALLPLSRAMGVISRGGIGMTDSHLKKSRTYAFPYIGFPVLQSRVQPHFAIFDLMEKIVLFEKEKFVDVEDCDELADYFDVHRRFKIPLLYCRELHDRWLLPVPADFLASLASATGDVKACTTTADLTRNLKVEAAGLLPDDSISCVCGEGRQDTDEERDVSVNEESDTAFVERMKQWIGNIHAGPPTP